MSNKWKREIEDVVEAINNANGECVFLIGAGFSFTAGIPLAKELISEIKSKHARDYERSDDKNDYNSVMSQLTAQQHGKLLIPRIENAKINWAHMALAQLFHHHNKKIDRILTLNFDPLIMRACAMIGCFPAVYDLATAHEFKGNRIAPRSVFYLNGQHTGFVMLNGTSELENHRQRLKEIVTETGSKRTWVVVGYSGNADPLLDILADVPSFDGRLYWIGFDEEPSRDVSEKLLEKEGKQAYYIGKQDADKFMTTLAQQLGCFPPELLSEPFTHINNIVKNIDFATGGIPGEALKNELASKMLRAQDNERKYTPETDLANNWMNSLLAGKAQEVVDAYQSYDDTKKANLSAEQKLAVVWAHIEIGNTFSAEAEATALAGTDTSAVTARWALAGEKYSQALEIKPDMHEALNNWGTALDAEAAALAGTAPLAATEKWALAGEKFSQALGIKSDMHDSLFNWGNALNAEAKALAGTAPLAATAKWALAGEKFSQALGIKPDMHGALNNWGTALDAEAKVLAGTTPLAATAKWALASEKYSQALGIKPDMHDALFNWGNALNAEAKALAGTAPLAATAKWALAGEKYNQALEIKPDMHEALNNWGNALNAEAKVLASTAPLAATAKWAMAGEKFNQALGIKPDMHNALNNWGAALDAEAKALAGTAPSAATAKWALAGEKYSQALEIKPDMHEALNNWGNALDAEATALAGTAPSAATAKWALAGEKYSQALEIKPDMHEALNNWGNALNAEATALAGTAPLAATAKWALAGEKFSQALGIKPDMHNALNNWGTTILQQYHYERLPSLLDQARDLLHRAEKLMPGSATYNLACLSAQSDDIPATLKWLSKCHAAGNLPDQQHIAADHDLDGVRNAPAFLDWLKDTFP